MPEKSKTPIPVTDAPAKQPEPAPAPAPEKKTAPAPAPEPAPDTRPVVTLEVWARLSGKKWDQLAGFQNYAKRQKLAPMPVAEWHAAFQKFENRPT